MQPAIYYNRLTNVIAVSDMHSTCKVDHHFISEGDVLPKVEPVIDLFKLMINDSTWRGFRRILLNIVILVDILN